MLPIIDVLIIQIQKLHTAKIKLNPENTRNRQVMNESYDVGVQLPSLVDRKLDVVRFYKQPILEMN